METSNNEEVMALIGIEFKTELKQPLRRPTHHLKPFLNLQLVYPQSLEVAESWNWDVISLTLMWRQALWTKGKHFTIPSDHVSSGDVRVIRHPKWLLQRIEEPNDHSLHRQWWGRFRSTPKPKLAWIWWPSTKNSGHFDGLKVCIVGDLDHHVAKSNATCKLKRLGATPLHFAGPDEWRSAEFEDIEPFVTIDEVISSGCDDVLRATRTSWLRIIKENYHRLHGLTQERYRPVWKIQRILMHPAPVNRDVEIATTW